MLEFFRKRRPIVPKVSCIIPAYNEAKTVGKVISEVRKVNEVLEVIVVDDGSTDGTDNIAKACGARVILNTKRRGKGNAMRAGLNKSSGSVILFLDADLIGLRSEAVKNLIMPILKEKADFVKGKGYFYSKKSLEKGINVTETIVKPIFKQSFPGITVFDPLSGQYCAKRKFFEKISWPSGYGVDISILLDAYNSNLRIQECYIGRIQNNLYKDSRKEVRRKSRMAQEVSVSISKKIRY